MSTPRQKAVKEHRRRARAQGLTRIEVQAPSTDAPLIRAVAEALRGDPTRAGLLRQAIASALPPDEPRNAFDIFGSDLPDETFDGVFETARSDRWREIDL